MRVFITDVITIPDEKIQFHTAPSHFNSRCSQSILKFVASAMQNIHVCINIR
jgi:hypothetical protein